MNNFASGDWGSRRPIEYNKMQNLTGTVRSSAVDNRQYTIIENALGLD